MSNCFLIWPMGDLVVHPWGKKHNIKICRLYIEIIQNVMFSLEGFTMLFKVLFQILYYNRLQYSDVIFSTYYWNVNAPYISNQLIASKQICNAINFPTTQAASNQAEFIEIYLRKFELAIFNIQHIQVCTIYQKKTKIKIKNMQRFSLQKSCNWWISFI